MGKIKGNKPRLKRTLRDLGGVVQRSQVENSDMEGIKTNAIAEINDKHRGDSLFIIGSGPSLCYLNDEQIDYLNQSNTIGVNRVQYKIKLKYFISAYAPEIMLFLKYAKENSQAFHMRPTLEKPIDKRIIPLKRKFYNIGEKLPKYLDTEQPTVITRKNVLFGALSLAITMQPKRIVLIGFEQKDKTHFYDFEEDIKEKIFYDYIDIYNSNPDLISLDKNSNSLYKLMKQLSQDKETLKNQPFYKINHIRLLSVFLNQIKDYGIEVYTTNKDGIAADAGAPYIPLDDFINNNLNINSSVVFKKKRIYNIKYFYSDLRSKYNIGFLKPLFKKLLPDKLVQIIKQYK